MQLACSCGAGWPSSAHSPAGRFETLPRIAELLGAGHLAASGRAPLARPIGDYVAEQVARESRGALAAVGDLPGYARVLRQTFRRLPTMTPSGRGFSTSPLRAHATT